jgi:hypothetical protein
MKRTQVQPRALRPKNDFQQFKQFWAILEAINLVICTSCMPIVSDDVLKLSQPAVIVLFATKAPSWVIIKGVGRICWKTVSFYCGVRIVSGLWWVTYLVSTIFGEYHTWWVPYLVSTIFELALCSSY